MTYNTKELNSQLTNAIASTLVDTIFGDLQEKLNRTVNINADSGTDIYDELTNLGYNPNSSRAGKALVRKSAVDTSEALKLFFKNVLDVYNEEQNIKIKEYINKQILDLNLKPTGNPNYMVAPDGKYYLLVDSEYVKKDNVIEVNSDGTYVTMEHVSGTKDCYLKLNYDINNKVISIKMINSKNVTYKNKELIANRLKLKKEFVKRFKLSGYSGHSSGFMAAIANIFVPPIETGYYMDDKYNIFKWNALNYSFEKELRIGLKAGAPIIADYEVMEKTVVRTDYDGKGLSI